MRKPENQDPLVRDLSRAAAPLRLKDLLYSVNISLKHRYLYCETPKVASSTIKLILQRLELGNLSQEADADVRPLYDRSRSPLLNPLQIPSWDELMRNPEIFKFCFVRNPYDRILSAFIEKFEMDQEARRHLLRKFRLRGELWRSTLKFRDFVGAVSRQNELRMNVHWRPQVRQVFWGAIAYDKVGRLESFAEDFGEVLRKIGVASPISLAAKANESGAAQRRADYYDANTARMVRQIYREDFEAFGYPLDLPA